MVKLEEGNTCSLYGINDLNTCSLHVLNIVALVQSLGGITFFLLLLIAHFFTFNFYYFSKFLKLNV